MVTAYNSYLCFKKTQIVNLFLINGTKFFKFMTKLVLYKY